MPSADFFTAERVAFLSGVTEADLRKRQRRNGFPADTAEDVEDAIAEGLLDLVANWTRYPSSLTGTEDFQTAKALKRLRWETPKHLDAIRSERTDLLSQEEVDGLREQEAGEPPRRRELSLRRRAMVKWALSELPERERTVLRALYGEAEPPSKRALSRCLGISEGMVRKTERKAVANFRALLEPWLSVLGLAPAGAVRTPTKVRSEGCNRSKGRKRRPPKRSSGRPVLPVTI